MTLEAIKDAIVGLPPEQRSELAAWLSRREMDGWDSEMERDFSPDGRGMDLLDRVKAEVQAGRFKPMDGLSQS